MLALLLLLGSHGLAAEAARVKNAYPMNVQLIYNPKSSTLLMFLKNQGETVFVLRSVSFGSAKEQCWITIDAPKKQESPTLPPPPPPDKKISLVKPGESQFLASVNLNNTYVLKSGKRYTVQAFFQDRRELLPTEILSAFWTVSNMTEPVSSEPLTLQIP